MEELTIADLEGRRICERLGRRAARSWREGRVKKSGYGRKTDRKTYKETPVESLTSLAFDGIMSGTPLSGVSPSRGFALGLRTG